MRTRGVLMVVVATLVLAAAPASAHRHHVHFGISLGWWGPWGWPGWYGGYYGGPYSPRPAQPPDLAAVDTDVSPEHARVYLDGTLIGTADDFDGYPDYLYLRPGTYTLELRLEGYETKMLTIEARPGSYVPVDFDLVRVPGTPATPWYDRPEGLPTARVFGPSPGAPSPEVPLEPKGPDTTLRPELDRGKPVRQEKAQLRLHVSPESAAVYVDGEFLATAKELSALHRGIAVDAGTHRIQAVAPGFASRTVEVQIAPGAEREVDIDLDAEPGQAPGDGL